MKVVLVAAMSVNGLIADVKTPDLSAWTSSEDKIFFSEIMKKNDLVVMGRVTYESVRNQIKLSGKKRRIIMTRNPGKYKNEEVPGMLEFTSNNPTEIVERMSKLGYKELLVLGGGLIKYNITISIKNNLLIPTAGIDESNGDGYYILWPKNPQKSANLIRQHLRNKFKLKKLGVIITDSKTTPLRWGTTGTGIGYSGFDPLNNYIDTPDVFGRHLRVTKANILDGLAAAAVVVMGEGDERTPIAVIEDIPFVRFVDNDPTDTELGNLEISIDDDLYAPLIKNADWHKGGGGK